MSMDIFGLSQMRIFDEKWSDALNISQSNITYLIRSNGLIALGSESIKSLATMCRPILL